MKVLGLHQTTVRTIIFCKWRKLQTGGEPCKDFLQESFNISSKRSHKSPDDHLKNCRPHMPQLKSMFPKIRKTLDKYGIHGRIARCSPLLTKENTKAYCSFANKNYTDDSNYFSDNILWTDESLSSMFWKTLVLLHLM